MTSRWDDWVLSSDLEDFEDRLDTIHDLTGEVTE